MDRVCPNSFQYQQVRLRVVRTPFAFRRFRQLSIPTGAIEGIVDEATKGMQVSFQYQQVRLRGPEVGLYALLLTPFNTNRCD